MVCGDVTDAAATITPSWCAAVMPRPAASPAMTPARWASPAPAAATAATGTAGSNDGTVPSHAQLPRAPSVTVKRTFG